MSAARLCTTLVLVLAVLAPIAPASADSLPGNSSYWSVQPDLRLCPAPLCGGFFVSLLNRRLARCADGTERETCHIGRINWHALGLNAKDTRDFEQAVLTGRGLVRGDLSLGQPAPGLDIPGHLVVTEGWIAATGSRPRGSFYRASDNGIVCVTTPCFSLREAPLNTKSQRNVSGLDLSRVGARAAAIEAAWHQLRVNSILVAGRNRERTDAGSGGRGVELVATQFYLRVRPSPRVE